MLKFKKLLAIAVASMTMLSLAACGQKADTTEPTPGTETPTQTEEPKKELPAMTTENITLTYASWGNGDLNKYLADQFMKKYPNIKVELVPLELATWNDGLLNLASAGQLPDAYWYVGNVDIALKNGWLGDMTEYFDNDPESENILETLKDQGRFDGTKKLAAPAFYQPYTVYLDKNLFKKLNVEMPSADWTYDEMIDLMKKMTVPEQGIYGYNDFTKLLTMAPIVNNDAWGEFGWDGTKYDMSKDWATALNTQAELVRSKVHAPFFDTDEAQAAFGDRLLWAASSGRVAMQLDAHWTINLFKTAEFIDKGIQWVPYPVPKGANAKSLHKPAFVDFGAISSATKHPREAYELLKFMGWGKEGWQAKFTAFETLKDAEGNPLFKMPEGLPLTNDQELWDKVKALLPQEPEYAAYLERLKEPIPLGGASQPGFQTFLDEVYFGGEYGDIEAAVINGTVNASDVAQDFSDKLNQYREEAVAALKEQ
jgi:multiple sugar transport system substrate-binding protein